MFEIGQKVRRTHGRQEGEIKLVYGGGWYSVAFGGNRFQADVHEKNLESIDAVVPVPTETDEARARRLAVEAKILGEMLEPATAGLAKARDEELAALAARLKKSHTNKDDLTARQEREQIQGRYDEGVKAITARLVASEEYLAAVAAADETEDDGA
jgi:hypothetical protein